MNLSHAKVRFAAAAALIVLALSAGAYQVWDARPGNARSLPVAIASPLPDALVVPEVALSVPVPVDSAVPDHDREQDELSTHGG